MRNLADLDALYEQELLPELRVLETRRRAALRRVLAWTGGLVGTAAVAGGLLAGQTGSPGPLLVLAVLALVASAIASHFLVKGYRAAFKERIVRRLVHFLDPGLDYAPGQGIDRQTFRQSTLFKHRIDRYRCEDLVHGRCGATALRFSEVHALYKTRGNKQTHWHTIFRGLFVVADFNKHFQGRTVVLPDTAERLFGAFGQRLQRLNLSRAELVKLEDPEFEREFVVHGTDQIEARYILSPSLMERILAFRRKTGKRVHLAFVDSCLFVAVSYAKNLFEPRLFRTVLSRAPIAEYVGDLEMAVGIVEDLNLNTRIWTKS